MNKFKRLIAYALFWVMLFTNVLPMDIMAKEKGSSKEEIPRRIIVKYEENADKDKIKKLSDKNNKNNKGNENIKDKKGILDFSINLFSDDEKDQLKTLKEIKKQNIEVLEVTEDVDAIIDALKNQEGVDYVQEDTILYSTAINDPFFELQWGLHNEGQVINAIYGEQGYDINLLPLWNEVSVSTTSQAVTLTTTSQAVTVDGDSNSEGYEKEKANITTGAFVKPIVVGVIDTGIDISHLDLSNSIYVNEGEIPNNGIDDDGNGYIDDVNGYDFYNDDYTVFDDKQLDAHGTHVAGTLAAEANDIGIVGTAPNLQVLPLKVLNGDYGYTSDVIEAIEYAESMGVKIINCSFGSYTSNPALLDAMIESDILFICSAGNDNQEDIIYPAGFDLSNIISVGALTNRGTKAATSNYGDGVHVWAPGEDIYSTLPDNTYGYRSGTSMSTPYVTAVLTILSGIDNSKCAAELKDLIVYCGQSPKMMDAYALYEGFINGYNKDENLIRHIEEETKQDMIKKAGVAGEEVGYYEGLGYGFYDALDIAEFNLSYNFEPQVMAQLWSDAYLKIELKTDLDYLTRFKEDYDLSDENHTMNMDYYIQGYPLDNIVDAYMVASALEINMEAIITKEAINLNDQLAINTIILNEAIKANGITLDELYKQLENFIQWKDALLFTQEEDGYYKYFDSKYNYRANMNEDISLHSGALNISIPIARIEGSNGFSFELKAQYNNRQASLFSHDYINRQNVMNDTTYGEKYHFIGVGWSWNLPNVIKYEGDDDIYLHLENGSVFKVEDKYLDDQTLDNSNLENYNLQDMKFVEYEDYENKYGDYSRYALIYKNGTKKYFDNEGYIIGMVDRYGNHIIFQYDHENYEYPVIKSIENSFVLQEANHSSIIEAIDEEALTTSKIEIAHAGNMIGVEDANKTTLFIMSYIPGYNDDLVLTQIKVSEDDLEEITSFEYSFDPVAVDYKSQDKDDVLGNLLKYETDDDAQQRVNIMANLTSVTYPAKGKTIYNYTKAFGNLGKQGSGEYCRVKSRSDIDLNNTEFNKVYFKYDQEKEYTGFGWVVNQEDFADHYTVTIDGDVITEYTLDPEYHLPIDEQWNAGTNQKAVHNEIDEKTHLIKAYSETHYEKYNEANNYKIQRNEIKDAYGDLIEIYDEYGNYYFYDYDDTYHQLKRVEFQEGEDISTRRTLKEYEIDEKTGNVLTGTIYHEEDGQSKPLNTSYTYDTYGNIIQHVTQLEDGQEKRMNYIYDPAGRKVIETRTNFTDVNDDEKISYQYFDYDYNSNQLIATSKGDVIDNLLNISYSGSQAIESIKATALSKVSTTRYEYDALGRVTKVINPDNTFLTIDYDVANNQITVTNELGYKIRAHYDVLGRQESIKELQDYDGTPTWVTIKTIVYNESGYVLSEEDANGHGTTYEYDRYGRPTLINNAGITTEYIYEDWLNKKTVIDDEEKKTEYYYDKKGNIKEIISSIDGKTFKTVYTYDNFSNPISITNQEEVVENNAIKVLNTRTKTYTYDDLNRLIQVEDPEHNITKYEYDTLGNVKKIITPEGHTILNEYDTMGRLIKRTDQLGNEEKYLYDELGYLIKSTDREDQNTYYQYDINGRKTHEVKGDLWRTYDYNDDGQVKEVSSNTGTIKYEYYINGTIKKEIAPDNKSIQYGYDKSSNRTSMTDYFGRVTEYTYERWGGLYRVENGDIDAKNYYYDNGMLEKTKVDTNPDIIQEYSYDGLNQLTGIDHKYGTSIINTFDYQYDYVGNLIEKVEDNKVTSFDYNDNGQVNKITTNNKTINYTYDDNGNIDTENNSQIGMLDYDYNAADRLTDIDGSNLDVTNDFDKNGNQQLQNNSSNSSVIDDLQPLAEDINYEYDAWNRLIGYHDEDTEVSITYDPMGRRLTKTVNGITTKYYYDGDYVINETENDVLTATNIKGIKYIARIDHKQDITGYYLYNGHGDVVNLIKDDGEILNTYTYGIYGEEEFVEETIPNPIRYSGEYYDDEMHLYYLRARYYNPYSKRFLTEDTYYGDIKSPLSLNLYTYCIGNPIKYVDPSGNVYRRPSDADYEGYLYRPYTETYVDKAVKQVVLGNYTDEVNLLGTGGQIAVGILGLDAPLDARDVYYDVTHWEWSWSHAGQTTLDVVAFVPVIGALKYSDEGAALVKGTKKGMSNFNWSSIKATQEVIEGTNVPRSFVINGLMVNGKEVWVGGNATKHIGEFITSANKAGGGLLSENEIMESFMNAARQASEQTLKLGDNRLFIGGWEIGINGETGVIYHALMK